MSLLVQAESFSCYAVDEHDIDAVYFNVVDHFGLARHRGFFDRRCAIQRDGRFSLRVHGDIVLTIAAVVPLRCRSLPFFSIGKADIYDFLQGRSVNLGDLAADFFSGGIERQHDIAFLDVFDGDTAVRCGH